MDPKSQMNDLLAQAKPALLAIPDESLIRPRVPRERAMQLTATLVREIEPLTSRFNEELSKARASARQADFQAVESYALVYYATDLDVEAPWTSENKARRAVLVKNVHEYDEIFTGWATPLFRKNAALADTIADIVRGHGTRDDAEDVVRWTKMFRDQWPKIKDRTDLTMTYIDRAEAEATELLRLLDADQDASIKGSPRDLRYRAFTRWAVAYSELCSLGRYLLRDEPDVAQRLPGIGAEKPPRPAKAGDAQSQPDKGAPAAPAGDAAKAAEPVKPGDAVTTGDAEKPNGGVALDPS